jgi:hypothetical protein
VIATYAIQQLSKINMANTTAEPRHLAMFGGAKRMMKLWPEKFKLCNASLVVSLQRSYLSRPEGQRMFVDILASGASLMRSAAVA